MRTARPGSLLDTWVICSWLHPLEGWSLHQSRGGSQEVEALVTALEPVAELVEVGLQVLGTDPTEDVELPALEV